MRKFLSLKSLKRFKPLSLVLVFTLMCNLTFINTVFGSIQSQTNKIMIVNAEISSDNSLLSYSISVNNIQIVDGKLKDSFNGSTEATQEDLKCSFTDENNLNIKSTIIKNPLIQKLEYSVDNKGTLTKEYNHLNKAALSIRTNYTQDMKYLFIETLDKYSHLIKIASIDLKQFTNNTTNATRADKFQVVKIIDNGSVDNMINFVIMGDGYTASEQTKFMSDAASLANYIFNDPTYGPYKNYFNVFAIQVISSVSGAANDPSQLINNYFGSTFNYSGIDRLLVPTNGSKVLEVLNNHIPQYDQPIVIVNSSKYGGSGGTIATASTNSQSPEILIHEVGHSFAGLSDEYWAGSQYARENVNMTQNSNPSTIKWKSFIGVNGVGVYQYESPGEGWYRPHQNCKMRYLGSPFCAVCTNVIKNKILSLVVIPSSSPTNTTKPSPTATPTPTSTNTPTPPQSYSLSGYIRPDFSFANTALLSSFKVEITGTDKTALTDTNGYFRITGIQSSTSGYSIKISKPNYLSRTISNVVLSGDMALGSSGSPTDLWAGDILQAGTQDNVINMADVIEISKGFNAVQGESKYNPNYDINLDSAINMSDIMILVKHFNKTVSDYPEITINSQTPTPTSATPTPISTNGSTIPSWDGNSHYYSVGDKVNYQGLNYECIQAHASNSGWTPSSTLSVLWKNIYMDRKNDLQ